MLSTGWISIQWITEHFLSLFRWIAIYPLDSVIWGYNLAPLIESFVSLRCRCSRHGCLQRVSNNNSRRDRRFDPRANFTFTLTCVNSDILNTKTDTWSMKAFLTWRKFRAYQIRGCWSCFVVVTRHIASLYCLQVRHSSWKYKITYEQCLLFVVFFAVLVTILCLVATFLAFSIYLALNW